MRTNVKIWAFFIAIALGSSLFVASCKKDMSTGSNATTPYNLYMTDAPGAYQAVNVNIVGAEVNSDISGWVKLNINAGIYNLLTLTSGRDTLLANGLVTVGHVSQIRLFLASTGNTVEINNTLYPLVTPSAVQSGVKLNVDATLMKGVTYNLTIDFDAGMSVVATGNGTYILKPVIRAVVSPITGGSIKGIITPSATVTSVVAISSKTGTEADTNESEDIGETGDMESDSASSFTDDVTGDFMIKGLAAGTYKVVITPLPPFTAVTYGTVTVSAGQVTDMGSITLH